MMSSYAGKSRSWFVLTSSGKRVPTLWIRAFRDISGTGSRSIQPKVLR